VPERAEQLGFHWAFPALRDALLDVVDTRDVTIERLAPGPLAADASAYWAQRPPRYFLRSSVALDAPLDAVFAFFSRPENLGAMTPADMSFQILGPVGPMHNGAVIDYRIRLGAVPLRWRTIIERVRPPGLFVDAQLRGPYRSWWHEHRFRAEGNRTVMEDRVYYALPFGRLGRLAHALFVAASLRRIFSFRKHAVRLRFGVPPPRELAAGHGVS